MALHDLTRAEALALIGSTPVGRIVTTLDGRPFAEPVNIATDDEGRIAFRVGNDDPVRTQVGAIVAIEVDEYDVRSHTGWYVLVVGELHDITDSTDLTAQRLRQLDLEPWAPGPWTRWLAVEPSSISGQHVSDARNTVPYDDD
jgi:uncharacterized protein